MNKEEILKTIFNFIFSFAVWFFFGLAIIIIYFFFNPDLVKQYLKLLVPALIYGLGMVISIWFRKRKAKVMVRGEGSSEFSIYINQFDLLKHDLLMFLTPLLIIGAAYFFKDEIEIVDITASAIALIGLYLSTLIYKRKING